MVTNSNVIDSLDDFFLVIDLRNELDNNMYCMAIGLLNRTCRPRSYVCGVAVDEFVTHSARPKAPPVGPKAPLRQCP